MTTQSPPSDHPLAPRWPRPCVGVPRQFSVGGLMLLVTMCAILFAIMQTLGANRETFCIISLLFVGVAAGQVLLFGGQKPRKASLWVGACLFPVEIIALCVYLEVTSLFSFESHRMAAMLCWLIFSIPAGAMLGYIAGTLSAGIFLVRRRFDKTPEEAISPLLQLQPLREADIDTLIAWTQSHRLFDRWAGTAFSYPLDRGQMTRHLQDTHGEHPDRHAFLAVCPRTERPLGYVELCRVPWQMRSVRIAHALIAPDESDRKRMCMELLIAAVRLAFDEMNFHRVETTATVYDGITKDCFLGVGFREEGMLRGALAVDGHYRGACVLGILEGDRLQQPPSRGTILSRLLSTPTPPIASKPFSEES